MIALTAEVGLWVQLWNSGKVSQRSKKTDRRFAENMS